MTKCLVGSVVLVEDGGGDIMGVSQVGDLGAGHDQWDGGLGAGVDGINEGRGQECNVHDGGDSEVKEAKCAVSEVWLDGSGVWVKF